MSAKSSSSGRDDERHNKKSYEGNLNIFTHFSTA